MNRRTAFYDSLGKRIRANRERRGLTQNELASCVAVSRTSVTNIELGRQGVQLHTLCRIAKLLDVALDDLVPEISDESAAAAKKRRIKR